MLLGVATHESKKNQLCIASDKAKAPKKHFTDIEVNFRFTSPTYLIWSPLSQLSHHRVNKSFSSKVAKLVNPGNDTVHQYGCFYHLPPLQYPLTLYIC